MSHVLNPRHRVLASGTGRRAGHSVPILRRCDGARPHDPQTWSATGKAYFRLPFLQPGRYKGSKAGGIAGLRCARSCPERRSHVCDFGAIVRRANIGRELMLNGLFEIHPFPPRRSHIGAAVFRGIAPVPSAKPQV